MAGPVGGRRNRQHVEMGSIPAEADAEQKTGQVSLSAIKPRDERAQVSTTRQWTWVRTLNNCASAMLSIFSRAGTKPEDVRELVGAAIEERSQQIVLGALSERSPSEAALQEALGVVIEAFPDDKKAIDAQKKLIDRLVAKGANLNGSVPENRAEQRFQAAFPQGGFVRGKSDFKVKKDDLEEGPQSSKSKATSKTEAKSISLVECAIANNKPALVRHLLESGAPNLANEHKTLTALRQTQKLPLKVDGWDQPNGKAIDDANAMLKALKTQRKT